MSCTKTIHAQTDPETVVSVITVQHTDVKSLSMSERISFTEFITSLCLLTKKAFMNGNKKSSDSLLNGHLKPRRVVAVQ